MSVTLFTIPEYRLWGNQKPRMIQSIDGHTYAPIHRMCDSAIQRITMPGENIEWGETRWTYLVEGHSTVETLYDQVWNLEYATRRLNKICRASGIEEPRSLDQLITSTQARNHPVPRRPRADTLHNMLRLIHTVVARLPLSKEEVLSGKHSYNLTFQHQDSETMLEAMHWERSHYFDASLAEWYETLERERNRLRRTQIALEGTRF